MEGQQYAQEAKALTAMILAFMFYLT